MKQKSLGTTKRSYWLQAMLENITNLPNRHNLFTQSNYVSYILDDYSVLITDEVRKAVSQS